MIRIHDGRSESRRMRSTSGSVGASSGSKFTAVPGCSCRDDGYVHFRAWSGQSSWSQTGSRSSEGLSGFKPFITLVFITGATLLCACHKRNDQTRTRVAYMLSCVFAFILYSVRMRKPQTAKQPPSREILVYAWLTVVVDNPPQP